MRCVLVFSCILLFVTSLPLRAQGAQDWQLHWPQWRGPTGDNHAPASCTAPVAWDQESHLAWTTPVPGRGHSSPTVLGNRIYLTTADEQAETQSLLIYDRSNGEKLAEKVVHRGGLTAELHPNNTYASSTIASDGERVFALFHNNGAAWVTAFDLNGKQLWQERAIGFAPQRYQFGFGSSPVVIDGKVVVASEYDGDESGIVALDAATGKQSWKESRPKLLSYSSPALAVLEGRRCLLLSGNYKIAAYDPRSGKPLWSTEATTQATCGTMVWDEQLGLAFASGGYPDTFTLAVRTTGDHEVVWTNRSKCYEQSMLVVGGYVYGVTDNGVVYCWRGSDGEKAWKERLGGKYSSSPVLVDGKIYVTNESGTSFVFAASPEGFQSLGENQLGTECFATPTPVGNRLYHRYANGSGKDRQEYLSAIGK